MKRILLGLYTKLYTNRRNFELKFEFPSLLPLPSFLFFWEKELCSEESEF